MYAKAWALALEATRPDLVARYLLDPLLPPPGDIEELLATGKVRHADAPDALPPSCRVLHSLSPLDTALPLTRIWPRRVGAAMELSATVYDCIPALDPEGELADPAERARYRVRFELLRGARQLLVLSGAVGRDLERLLSIPARRIVLAGAAPCLSVAAPEGPGTARARARAHLPALRGRYVLYPSGSHPRKNNERLVEAWAALPDRVAQELQLVITGELPPSTRHHLEARSAALGRPGGVLTTGYVDDPLLAALLRGAELVCFPSLSEGLGLPVLEALGLGVPVIASDRPPFDELLGPGSRFDPERPQAIAAALAAALGRSGQAPDGAPSAVPEASDPPPAGVSSWEGVALRSAAAFDALLARLSSGGPRHEALRRGTPGEGGLADRGGRHAAHRQRRIAFVGPLPPAPTGIARYSARLIEELEATGTVTVDAFADGPTPDQRAPDGRTPYRVASLQAVEEVLGGYDRVVYSLGNSHHHLGALAALRRRPGVVLCHDVRLTNLYRHEHGRVWLLPGGLRRTLENMYGDLLPDRVGADGSVSSVDAGLYGLLMLREVVSSCERLLVFSEAARRLALLDGGSRFAPRIAVLPFPFELPRAGPPERVRKPDLRGGAGPGPVAGAADRPGADAGRTVVAHFGIVDPVKEPGLLLEAYGLARSALARPLLAFVGPVGEEPAAALRARAVDLGCSEELVLTGALPDPEYGSWLDRATVAVQLRRTTNGEASAAVGECLAAGLPTIVSDIGWARELPDDAVVKLPVAPPAPALAEAIVALATDGARRAALSQAALAEAGRRGAGVTARALLAELELAS